MKNEKVHRVLHALPRWAVVIGIIVTGLLAAVFVTIFPACGNQAVQLVSAAPEPISVGTMTHFAGDTNPTGLVYGPELSYWFTLGGANAIGVYEPSTITRTIPLPTSNARPLELAIGSGDDLWFTEPEVGQIGHLNIRTDQFHEFDVDSSTSYPAQIALGQDGAYWFTEFEGNRIGRIAPDGTLQHYPLPNPNSLPVGIVTAPNGDLWFTEWGGYRIGRLTPQGNLKEFDIPGAIFKPSGIAVGPDNAIWFTYEVGSQVGRIDPTTETIQTFSLTSISASILDITNGPDGKLWFLGVASVGRFDASAAGPKNLIETGIPSIFEGEGRSQIIAGPDVNMVFITSNTSDVFTATVPGGATLKDLQIFINDIPSVLLAGGEFTVTAEIYNWGSSTVNGVQIAIPLDNDIRFEKLMTPSGSINCPANNRTLNCSLGTILPNSNLPLTLTLHTDRTSPYPTTRRVDLIVSQQEMDFQPANNRTYRDLTLTSSFDYFNDFTIGSDSHWSFTQTHQTASGLSYLGMFDNETLKFNWNDLPPHDRVSACFELYILGGWDGSTSLEPQTQLPLSNFIGPDLWSYYLDQHQMLIASFSNREDFNQSYPDDYNLGSYPARQAAIEIGDFDDLPVTTDARYRMCNTMPHTSNNLDMTFISNTLNEQIDEKWAIDNVHLRVYYQAAFDFLYLPFVIGGGD